MTIKQTELFWLIGILEGEGNFNYIRTQSIYVAMTDSDVIYKVADLFTRIGNRACFVFEREMGGNRKTQYCARIHGPEARAVMNLIVKHMGQRRRQKIWQCLNKHRGPTRKYTHHHQPVLPSNVVKINRRF